MLCTFGCVLGLVKRDICSPTGEIPRGHGLVLNGAAAASAVSTTGSALSRQDTGGSSWWVSTDRTGEGFPGPSLEICSVKTEYAGGVFSLSNRYCPSLLVFDAQSCLGWGFVLLQEPL